MTHPGTAGTPAPVIAGIPVEFLLFGLVLLGVAVFHRRTLGIALAGVFIIALHKLAFTGFPAGAGLPGLGAHLAREWVLLANLLGLLTGFGLLSRHFEASRIPALLPRFLPDDWKGGFVLLLVVFVLSSFLDNIAAALIGGAMARELYRGRVHPAFLAALVAASNAGGAGSVVGDTTTTMIWLAGVPAADVARAFLPALAAAVFAAFFAARRQQAHSPILRDPLPRVRVDWKRVGIVALILGSALGANLAANLRAPGLAARFPVIGAAVWLAILASAPVRRPDWRVLPATFKGALFLLSLVLCASMMPVDELPAATWKTALGLGFVSAVFDNIPLTALAIQQGGYDWGGLAYAVGFGGSMMWFGSSAGVALTSLHPEARSAGQWLRHGWFIVPAYLIGFLVLLAVLGWESR